MSHPPRPLPSLLPDPTPALRDPSRLRALAETGLLDSAPEETFDRITRLALRVLGGPTALVSLVDDGRQFFKSARGLGEPWASRRGTPLTHSFCQYAVAAGEPLVVEDARTHPTLAGNGAVDDLGVVAYLGVPLVTPDRHALGALCVASPEPRPWTADEVEFLRELAASAVTEIELRRATRAAEAAERRYRELITGLDAVVWEADFATARLTFVSPQCEALTGHPPERWLAAPDFAASMIHPDDVGPVARCYREARRGRESDVEFRAPTADGRTVCVRGRLRPVRGDDGAVRGARGVLVDVTDRKRAEDELRAQTATVRLLQAAAVAANQAATSDEALLRCLDLVREHAGWQVGHVYRARGGELVPTDLWCPDDAARFAGFREATMGTRLSACQGPPGRALATGRAAWMEDVGVGPGFPRAAEARAAGLRSGFAFPVLVGDEVAAVLEFYSSRVEPADATLLDAAVNVGMQLGRVIERERHAEEVRALSLTDELTGLHNRRGFLTLAGRGLKVAARLGRHDAILFLDLDGLKGINDTLGHEAGDRAITDFAGVLRETFRDADLLARLGGDEFAVMAAACGADDARGLVARLHEEIARFNARAGRPYALAVSAGVTTCDPARAETVEAILARADAEMYEAKRARKARARGA